jgi:hypothetical protein
MSKLVAGLISTVFIFGLSLAPWPAAADAGADKAGQLQATALCKSQVKDYAKYNETSWWQRHKMVQKCVKDALAKK